MFIKKLFASNEVKAMLQALDEAEMLFKDNRSFPIIKKHIMDTMFSGSNPDKIKKQLSGGLSPKIAIYSLIGNTAADLLESGRYHIYRGVLEPFIGEDMLKLYDASAREMLKFGAPQDEEFHRDNRAILLKNIAEVG